MRPVKIIPRYGAVVLGDGTEITARMNPPFSVYAALQSNDAERIIGALSAIVKEHPFVDENGTPLTIADLPEEVAVQIVSAYGDTLRAIPKG